jgi:hypothetical protein
LLPSLVWAARDRAVWPWDQSWYGEVSVRLWYTLRHQPEQWFDAMEAAIGSKPPAVTYLGQFFVPLRRWTGSVEFPLHLSILFTQMLTLAVVWRMGRRQLGGATLLVPLAGCLLVASAPLFVGISNQYFVEPIQTLAIAWTFYAALASPRWTRLEALGHLLGAAGLGMLAKTTTPLYCLLPGLLAARRLLPGARTEGPPARGGLLRELIILAAGGTLFRLAVVWYAHNLTPAWAHAVLASGSEVDGRRAALLVKLAYWAWAVRNALFVPVSSCLFVAVLAVAVLRRLAALRSGAGEPLRAADWVALCALAHLGLMLLAFSRSVNEATHYLMPALPALAYLLMWSLERLRARAIAVLVVAVFAVQWLGVHAIALGGLARPANLSCWLLRPDPDESQAREVEGLVEVTSEGGGTANKYCIIGVEVPWFNANSFSFFAEKQHLRTGYRCWYTSLGYLEQDVERAMRRIDEFKTVYLVTRESDAPLGDERFNRVSRAVLQRLRRDPAWQERRFPGDPETVLFRRSATTDSPRPGRVASPPGTSAAAGQPPT